jgi:CheY-like chemotaxis protein
MTETKVIDRPHILVVEDNDADVFLLKEAISLHKIGVSLHVVENGALAIAYIETVDKDTAAACPLLCLLDMNLPLRSGPEVLRQLRQSKRMSGIPAIIMTSSKSQNEREDIIRLGASAYFHKPISYSDFMEIGNLLRCYLPAGAA